MTHAKNVLYIILLALAVIACSGETPPSGSDNSISSVDDSILEQALKDVEYLASDELGGRETGTEGNQMAREYIEARFDSLGLQIMGESFRQRFDQEIDREESGNKVVDAYNLIGYVEGAAEPDRFIVLTAHYDHLGTRDGEIFNGADDNASGTAGLLAAADYFSQNLPDNSILFIAFDAEEKGLAGARYFVENPVIQLNQVALNINMDMISTNFENELYAVGTAHYPYLKPWIEEFTEDAPVNVLFGYDTDEWDQNWTLASDHGPFHQKGVPFIYFGVEDHEHYHAPTDEYSTINQDFFQAAIATIINVIEGLDERLDVVEEEAAEEQGVAPE